MKMSNKKKKTYHIYGRVISSKTRRGVAGLSVEAWDKDLIWDDLVGSAVTDKQGTFQMNFDESYFRELFLDRHPDLFFKVFHKGKLLKSTKDSVLWNVKKEETKIAIDVDFPPAGGQKRPKVQIAVYDHKSNRLPNARVALKSITKKSRKVIHLKYDKQWQVYQAPDVNPGNYLLQVEAEGFESDQREVQVDPAGLKEKFILGKKGMPFYYRGKVKVPFEPPSDLLGVSVKPDLSGKQEEELLSYARELKLQPEEVSELIREENVRVFRFPPRTREQNKREIQQHLSEHSLVRLVGPIIRIDKESVSFLTNELVMRFKSHITEGEVYNVAKRYELNVVRTIPYAGNAFLLRVSTQASYDLLKICAEIVKSEHVEYAQPNLFTTAVDDFIPNDFLYALQPHHQIINSEDAWDITMGDNDIIIAVVDSGCDFDHPDFTNDPALGWDKVYSPYNFWDMDNNPTSGTHGTKSSGIATAIADNNEGVAGVAPGCRLMPIRRPPGGTDINHADMYVWIAGFDPGWVADGVNYAVDTVFPAKISPGADLISNSFGYTDVVIDGIVKDALDFITAFGRGGKGCIVLFSVGNDTADFTTYRMWAAYEKTIAVASSAISPPDAVEIKVSTSNYGSAVDVCAPGGGPAGGAEARALSTTRVGQGDTAGSAGAVSNDYDDFGQTSCACPQVAGIAALMLSINPDLTWVQVRQIIQDTAVQIDAANTDPTGQWVDTDGDGIADYSQWYGYGRVDARAAIQEAQNLIGANQLNHIDTWIKENSADVGDVPTWPPYSPDVWVRNLDPTVDDPAQINQHQSPIRGQDNWVYANIRNRGAVDSHDVYVRISITRWAGTQYIYPDDFIPTVPPSTDPVQPLKPGTYLIGEVHIDTVPANSVVTIYTVWPASLVPPASVVIDGVAYSWADACLLVDVSPHDGPPPTGNNTWDNNNICQKNVYPIDPPEDTDDMSIAFVAGHHANFAKLLNLRIERKNLPAEVELLFDYIDKETTKEVTGLLDKQKERPYTLDTCDLTVLTEAKCKIQCPNIGEISPVIIAPNTRLTLPCCHLMGKPTNYRLHPVHKDNRTVFALPTARTTYVPVPRKGAKYQAVAILGNGLRSLKKGDYQINVYQEDLTGKIEGGVNFILRKR